MPPRSPKPIPQAKLQDVADRAGVSLATASMAISNHPSISNQTRRAVWEVSRQLGYDRLRGRGSSSKSVRIGVVLVPGDNPHAAVHPSFFFDVVSRADDSYRFEYTATPKCASTQQAVEHTLQFAIGMDGLIFIEMVDHAFLNAIHKHNIPHLVVGNIAEPITPGTPDPSCTINFDAQSMGYTATHFLLKQGHTQIAFLCETLPRGFQCDQWLRGYRVALSEHGLLPNPTCIGVAAQTTGGLAALAQTWATMANRPTAIVAAESTLVPGVVHELARHNVRLDPSQIVVNCLDESARDLGIAAYPRIAGRIDLMVNHAITLLSRLIDEPVKEAYRITVPHLCRNM